MIWHKTDTVDARLQQAASPTVYTMEIRKPRSLSGGNYEYKVMHYRSAGEFIYSPAKSEM